jgi:hypothetical protein
MITEKPHNINWNFFISLEKDLENISRYIEFSENNFNTYSIELSRLLFAASSEVDVVAKQLCKLLNPKSRARNIENYQKEIIIKCPNFPNEEIYVERYGLKYKPWINWNDGKNPFWWKSYNNVKHQRDLYYQEANLKNAINSLGALLILLFYYYGIPLLQSNPRIQIDEVMRKLEPESTLIHLNSQYYPRSLGIDTGHLLSETIQLVSVIEIGQGNLIG